MRNRVKIFTTVALFLFAITLAIAPSVGHAFQTSEATQSVGQAAPVVAASPAAAPKIDTGDTAWMLASSALVLLMTPALALFYAGMARRKNALGTMMHSFLTMGLISVLWALVGYSLAFHEGKFWGGFEWSFLHGVGADPDPYGYAGTIPHTVFMAFQLMFAIITPALFSGSIAERIKFSAMFVFMTLWSIIIYSPLAHWVWGKGGMLRFGDPAAIFPALDFAGGTVVHISSGVTALVACLVLGKRIGYGKGPFLPHNLTMTLLGTGLLWFGWFGFNAGSAVTSGGLAGSAFIATHFAAAAAALTWIFAEWVLRGKPTALGFASGAVAGLVAITPASGYVTPMAALIIGGIAGVVCFWATSSLKNMLGYDDSLDVFGVHGVGGTLGALLTGVFASTTVNPAATNGLLHGNPGQLWNQFMAVAITWVFAGGVSFILLKIVDAVIGLRVSSEDEMYGLDQSQHGEAGYNWETEG